MRVKEFLSIREIDFISIDVTRDAAGLAELKRLGVRSTPVVSRGKAYVHGLVLADVAKFVGVTLDARMLAPAQLLDKMELILTTAQRLIRQIPGHQLGFMVPDRDRTLQALSLHIFKIPEAFLEAVSGKGLTQSTLDARPHASDTAQTIAEFGKTMQLQFRNWAKQAGEVSFEDIVETYYGGQPIHELLERTCWHSAQHLRQLNEMLKMIDITPDGPLTASQLRGLPLPKEVWG